MQKRLSVARALLTNPSVLLVDEATHDLDPHAAAGVRDLVAELARRRRRGPVDDAAPRRDPGLRGPGDSAARGPRPLRGTVNELMAHAQARRFVLRLGDGLDTDEALRLDRRLAGMATCAPLGLRRRRALAARTSNERSVLGDAIAALSSAGVPVLACHRERSEVEDAFVSLSRGDGP